MKRQFVEIPLLLLAAVVLDQAVSPALFGGRCWFLFLPATVLLAGLRHGPAWGAGAGWLAALLGAALSAEPLGLAMLRLGLLGFVSGFLAGLPVLAITPLSATIAGALLLVHELGMALLAAVVWGVTPRPPVIALLLTWAGIALWLGRRPIQPGGPARSVRDWSAGHAGAAGEG